MYIYKKKFIGQILKEEKKDFKPGDIIICQERKNDEWFDVFRKLEEGFSSLARFINLKDAVDYATQVENPTMINNGYTIVKLHGDLLLAIYYNHYESEIESKLYNNLGGFRLNSEAYKLGDSNISVCFAERVDEEIGHEERQILVRMNTMCEESLDPETFEKWEQVKDSIISTRKAFK